MRVEFRRVHARGRAAATLPRTAGYPNQRRADTHAHIRGTRADAEGTRGITPCGARQAISSLEPWSVAFRIWSACVVLGSSLRSSATNSSRLALMPRTSSNEAK